MSRSSRLSEILVLLRGGKLWRAEDLARHFGISIRTIYRDMDTLAQSGIPIEGERGVGYLMPAITTLPPLNLSKLELEALHVGLAAVGTVDDPDLRAAAQSLSAKVDHVLPTGAGDTGTNFGFATYPFADGAKGFQYLPTIRAAIRSRQKLRAIIQGGQDILHPYNIEYLGRIWVLDAWSETQNTKMQFRLEEFDELRPLPTIFTTRAN